MEQKSILGLNTVKAFVIAMLSLAIIGIISLVVLGSFSSTSLISQVGIPLSGTSSNESTVTAVSEGGVILSKGYYNSPICTVTQCVNATSGTVIPTVNYTATSCTVKWAGAELDAIGSNNSVWKCSYSWSYKDSSGIDSVTKNTSAGLIGFFGNSVTFFALLGVVVIILIISLVVVVVNRFGGESTSSSGEVSPQGEGNL
jgi:hypothetical protein